MDTSKIIPINHSSLVKPYEGIKQTSGGLEVSHTNETLAPVMGTVIMISEDSKYKVGDIVIFRKFAVDEFKFQTEKGEEKVYLVEDNEVKALYTGELPK